MPYLIPKGVSEAAARAVAWIEEGLAGRGFTRVGATRARQLARGGNITTETAVRMRSYFARHQNDKQAEGFNYGEPGFPSPGRVAWDAWGGDEGERWVNRILG